MFESEDGGLYDTWIDGVSLRRHAWNIKTFGGLMGVPARRPTDREIPGQHGVLHIGGETYEPGSLVLDMWVLGSMPDGSVPPVARRDQMMRNARDLVRLFSRPGLRKIEQGTDHGKVYCHAKVVSAIDFTTQAGVTRAEFKVEMLVPHPFWKAQTASVSQLTPTAGGTYTLSEFAGAFGPQTNLEFMVTGPWEKPKLTNPTTGQWVMLDRNLAALESWEFAGWESQVSRLNALTHTLRGGTGTTWLDLDAEFETGPRVTLGGKPGSGAKVSVVGRKQYLIP